MTSLKEFFTELPEIKGGDFDPIPAGEYQAWIETAEKSETKKGDGTILKLKWIILDGDHTNRIIFDNLNIQNPNEVAVKISLQSLAEIQAAIGEELVDTDQMINKPMMIKVGIEPDKGDYPPRNKILKRKPMQNSNVEVKPLDNSKPWES